jgi:hypothetical protein
VIAGFVKKTDLGDIMPAPGTIKEVYTHAEPLIPTELGIH